MVKRSTAPARFERAVGATAAGASRLHRNAARSRLWRVGDTPGRSHVHADVASGDLRTLGIAKRIRPSGSRSTILCLISARCSMVLSVKMHRRKSTTSPALMRRPDARPTASLAASTPNALGSISRKRQSRNGPVAGGDP
jgi:hypothetical protein